MKFQHKTLFRALAGFASAVALVACLPASAEVQYRLAGWVPTHVVEFEALDEKEKGPAVDALGRLRVGPVRVMHEAAVLDDWAPVAGGFMVRVRMTSKGAVGLRTRLELSQLSSAFEVRARGEGTVEMMTVRPELGDEAWTPWTEGETQTLEIFSPTAVPGGALRVGGLLHFNQSPLAKAAASCTLSTACPSGEAALDAAIAERKKSVFKIQFQENGSGFVCSATLIDTPRRPAAYALTANHCVSDSVTAATIEAWWFYEASACGSTAPSTSLLRVAGGAQLTFTNYAFDGTLLLLNQLPLAGALYSPINPALLPPGQSVVSISHPRGDSGRWATGTGGTRALAGDYPQPMYRTTYTRGIVEPGSSGSGLFTMNAGRLELRGILSQASTELSCASAERPTFYGRLEGFYSEIAQYIGAAATVVDDAPNRPQDLFGVALDFAGTDAPLNARASTLVIGNKRIDYAGDVDVFRFTLSAPAYVSAWTEGAVDTVGSILDSRGSAIVANDDADWSASADNNFGLTRQLQPGTYFVQVGHFLASGTGSYSLHLRADTVDANYTDLWSSAAEAGWGLNINHQGNTLFATLYTYDAAGTPLWLVMSNGARQADGSYSGALYRGTGTPFSAVGWNLPALAEVGTMRLVFSGTGAATLQYTFDGVSVTKAISRFAFSSVPTCRWDSFDRASARNFQDIWWTPSEPGWGLSIAHQGNTLFATLYVYGADGRGTWLVMSDGNRNINGVYVGALYRTRGPAFNAAPWSAVTLSQVGTATLGFGNGNAGTLTYTVDGVTVTKQVQRNVFGMPKTLCEE